MIISRLTFINMVLVNKKARQWLEIHSLITKDWEVFGFESMPEQAFHILELDLLLKN